MCIRDRPYLDNQNADRGYKIEAVGLTVNFPMGVYSKKYKSWDAVPELSLIHISDYVVPNAALDAGDLQANSFQNQPYLDNQKADRGYKIEAVGLTVNFPMGVYYY